MIRFTSVLFIAIFASVSYGVTIKGQVIDSTTAQPLSGVSVKFRLGSNPGAYPQTFTDTNGRFSKDVIVEPNAMLQILFERSDYLFCNLTVPVAGDTIDVGQIKLRRPAEYTVYFCGKVLDSVTGKALARVRISLLRKGNDPFLECLTDSVGAFGISVPVTWDMDGKAWWSIAFPGYYTARGTITEQMDSVSQTILLRAEGSIRVQVSGKVVNLQTRMPVPGACVILSTNYLGVKPDTSTTGADGLFDRSVQAGETSAAIPSAGYRITAPGYVEKYGYVLLGLTNTVDFGEIALTVAAGVKMPGAVVPARSDGMRRTKSLMLNGRVLVRRDNTGTSQTGVPQGAQVIVNDLQKRSLTGVNR
jgi:hypothetical protein